ncbi:putative DNA-binding protein (MmcQ/YjbR family) [Lewinella marina]|uniref:MmcQ-like protein n=1 Tax=Neolewinella marina TaxID=438751 RepID=A0A2G0CCD1_9BACT|nr:MmcQ/YjbR family DNA-binding protein [Neolewinella marina]NJB87700.1 putative DNA-binding protein (MmcQ/YjbR family) [Neolewinella marina]PHK97621.1 MmcQ-like protein [Neolewinella marina]
MNLETFRAYCLAKPATTESLPFGPDTLVLKVAGKMFALTGLDAEDFRINLKCEPQRAIELRERHPEIVPGYHMNKRHWNTVRVEQGQFTDAFVESLIDHSYDLVVAGLPKKVRAEWAL